MGGFYLPKSVREEAGMHPGDIIRLEADKSGWIGLMKVELIEAGDQSPGGHRGICPCCCPSDAG